MAPLTRHTHYATLPRSPHARGTTKDAKAWTQASALQALKLFIEEEGRLPDTRDLRVTDGMPTHPTIMKLFGGIDAFLGRERAPAHPRPATPASHYAKEVSCPRCGERWQSPDSRAERYCSPGCRNETAQDEDGRWLTGAVVTLKSSCEFTAWEVRAYGT